MEEVCIPKISDTNKQFGQKIEKNLWILYSAHLCHLPINQRSANEPAPTAFSSVHPLAQEETCSLADAVKVARASRYNPMLSKNRRLVKAFFKDPGRRVGSFSSPLFSATAYAPARSLINRCAVVVSKKTEKTAVSRNRLRRRLYAVLAEALPQTPNLGLRIVFYPTRTLSAASVTEIRGAVRDALHKFTTL